MFRGGRGGGRRGGRGGGRGGRGPRRVEKHYAITQNENQVYILPIKAPRNPYDGGRAYMGGLPNLFGGNRDQEDPSGRHTAAREIGEESQGRLQVQDFGPHAEREEVRRGDKILDMTVHHATIRGGGGKGAHAHGAEAQEMGNRLFRFSVVQGALVVPGTGLREPVANLDEGSVLVAIGCLFFETCTLEELVAIEDASIDDFVESSTIRALARHVLAHLQALEEQDAEIRGSPEKKRRREDPEDGEGYE